MPSEELVETPKFQGIGGGLSTLIVDGAIAPWNDDVPGRWIGPHTLKDVGSYVSKFCEPQAGIYRLIGLDNKGKPAALDRICGCDRTGTLYIGREGKNFAVRSRLSKLVRALREPRGSSGVRIYNDEHNAGYRLRHHPMLSLRFPISKLALTWCYSAESKEAERCLLDFYFWSFGDTPPLNRE
ncbi:MAG: hypothetical protein FJX62_04430 [Alphaproteobacteria bacterium]|nr:hypothetical protein [Alphaproteobacteria bacterium]